MSDAVRQLKVQTKACQRYVKEISSYEKEAEQQRQKVKKLEESGADGHTVNKQKEVLEETQQMIPECRSLLEKALDELEMLVQKCAEDEKITAGEEYQAAATLLQELRP